MATRLTLSPRMNRSSPVRSWGIRTPPISLLPQVQNDGERGSAGVTKIGHVEETGSGVALRGRGPSVSDHPQFQDSEPLPRIVTRPASCIVTRVCIFVKTFMLA